VKTTLLINIQLFLNKLVLQTPLKIAKKMANIENALLRSFFTFFVCLIELLHKTAFLFIYLSPQSGFTQNDYIDPHTNGPVIFLKKQFIDM